MRFGVDADKEAGRMEDDGGNVLAFQHGRANLRQVVRLVRLLCPDFAFKACVRRRAAATLAASCR